MLLISTVGIIKFKSAQIEEFCSNPIQKTRIKCLKIPIKNSELRSKKSHRSATGRECAISPFLGIFVRDGAR